MAIQDCTWSYGMHTLGSAEALEYLPFLKAHRMTEVAQAPTPIMPVDAAMLDLHLLVVVGAIPTAVWPYICAGLTPVSANLLALWFFFARMLVRRARVWFA